jgi:hypothetical protein
MNFVSFCNVYQDIDAAFLLYQEKKAKVTERETHKKKEVPCCRHKSKSVKSSSSQRMDFVSFCDVYEDIDAAFTLDQEKKKKDRERER